MFKYIVLFLLSFSIVGLGGCSMLPEMPALFGGKSDSEASSPDSRHSEASSQNNLSDASSQSNRSEAPSYGMMSLVGSTLKMVPAPLKVAGINTALGLLGTGFKAGFLEDDEENVQISGNVKGLPIDLFFNLSGQTTSDLFTLRLADIDIPLSKAGVTPALESNLVRLLQKKGVDEQTTGSILSGLQQVISVTQKYLQ